MSECRCIATPAGVRCMYCTRRDAFAAAALQGLLARYGDDGPKDVAAGLAVGFADALIAALDAPKRDPLDQALNEGDGSYRP